jgi:hypothetical protein
MSTVLSGNDWQPQVGTKTHNATENRSSKPTNWVNGSVKVREALFEDYPQIARLQAEHDFPRKCFEEWVHLWVNNPAYIQFKDKSPIGWVLEGDDRQLVGYLGNIPLFYEFGGQRLIAYVAHAWVVDKRYRSYSLVLLDRYFSQRTVDLFLNATVGPAAFESFAVFKSLPVPVGSWDHSTFWITNCQGLTAAWLAKKKIPLARSLSYLFSVPLFVKDALSKRTFNHGFNGLELHDCTLIDDRFDVFWTSLKQTNRNVLMGVRSREVLQWHFQAALSDRRAWLITANKGPVITAYAIFFRHDNQILHVKRMRLVDFQSLDGDAAALAPMLAWAVNRCRWEGIDMLESIGLSGAKGRLIDGIAPYERKLPSWLYFYKARDKGLAERLSDSNAWDPSQFDGDASL